MENMSDQEICNFCKSAIETLQNKKKEEVMKCVGNFVYNPKIAEINQKIVMFQKQCTHLKVSATGQCCYCKKQISNIRGM